MIFLEKGWGVACVHCFRTALRNRPHDSFAKRHIVVDRLAACRLRHSPAPELRPYSAEESRELALEALSRRGLSFDEYQAKKAQLLPQPSRAGGFDPQAEMNAERSPQLHGRAS